MSIFTIFLYIFTRRKNIYYEVSNDFEKEFTCIQELYHE